MRGREGEKESTVGGGKKRGKGKSSIKLYHQSVLPLKERGEEGIMAARRIYKRR